MSSIPTPKEFIEAGAHIGHKKSRWNPKMTPFVFGVRNNFHIIDAPKAIDRLEKAITFLKEVISSGGVVLFTGVKVQSYEIVKNTAESIKMPYMTGRWIGGLFTNFKVLKKRIEHFKKLEEDKNKGEFDKYTKKEKLHLERELKKMQRELGGIKDLKKLPQAIFVSDVQKEMTAVLEAKKAGIPVVAIVDTDADPTLIDWPIPANDGATASLKLIYNAVKEELKDVKVSSSEEETKKETKEKKEKEDKTK